MNNDTAECFACNQEVKPANTKVTYHICRDCAKDDVQMAKRVDE